MKKQIVHRECFFVGGSYTGTGSNCFMRGQMYVEAWTPELLVYPLPIVFVHGAGQTAMNWMNTPDGRPGWADWFVNRGWRVYLVDLPARGRSAWQPALDEPQKTFSASNVERNFTATAFYDDWPQSKLHTQWPGGANKGRFGDPVFDQYYASCVSGIDVTASEPLVQAAGAALLDRIGPAILLGHSQGGLLTWLVGDARPNLVKAIIAVEPSGPPYKDVVFGDRVPKNKVRSSGLTTTPLTYDPPVTMASPVDFVQRQPGFETTELAGSWQQNGTPRRLTHLAKIPVMLVTAEASYHSVYDHCTVHYLVEAGVNTEHIRLADHGIRGNGHMMMLEMNNLEIASLIETWMIAHIEGLIPTTAQTAATKWGASL